MVSVLGLLLAAGLVAAARAGEKQTGSFKGWFNMPTVCGESATFHDEASEQDYFVVPQNVAEGYENREVVIQGTLEDYRLTIDSIKEVPADAGN